MVKDLKPTKKQIAYKHKMMKKMTEDKYTQAREQRSTVDKDIADIMKAKLDKSVRTFKLKGKREQRQKFREDRRRPLVAKLDEIEAESWNDSSVSSDSSDYDIFGNIAGDPNPSSDDDEPSDAAGAGTGSVEVN